MTRRRNRPGPRSAVPSGHGRGGARRIARVQAHALTLSCAPKCVRSKRVRARPPTRQWHRTGPPTRQLARPNHQPRVGSPHRCEPVAALLVGCQSRRRRGASAWRRAGSGCAGPRAAERVGSGGSRGPRRRFRPRARDQGPVALTRDELCSALPADVPPRTVQSVRR